MRRKRRSGDAIPRNARERESQKNALAALSLARRECLSLSSAAKAEQIKRSSILKWTGSAWKKRGRDWRPEPRDRIHRPPLTVPGTKGQRLPVSVRTSKAASQISRYHIAIKSWLKTENASVLKPFRGKRVPYGKGLKFVTNPTKLRDLKSAGLLDLDRSIYVHK
jgi:hypothetical protein